MSAVSPEAVEAVVEAMSAPGHDFPHAAGQRTLAFIRDAIHRDGDDADAIRQALGLSREQRENLAWIPGDDPDDSGTFVPTGTAKRRVVGEWKEAAP